MADATSWYLNRASGIVSLLLLTGVLVLGLLTAGQAAATPGGRAYVAGLHRLAGLLGLAFVGLHVFTAVADEYVDIRWYDAVVPFVSGYDPFWVGLGTVALDLMLALVVTSLLRGRLSRRAWRAVHWSAYGLWPIALGHGLGAGTDLGGGWYLGLAVACVLAVLGALAWRLARRSAGPGRHRPATVAVVPYRSDAAGLIRIGAR